MQSLSCSLLGLGEPAERGVITCGGLQTRDCFSEPRKLCKMSMLQKFYQCKHLKISNVWFNPSVEAKDHYLSLLLSHSSCASRRILSCSPCRAEETLSWGPVRLSLRLKAAINSSTSTQEPKEEKQHQYNCITVWMGLAYSATGETAKYLEKKDPVYCILISKQHFLS